jgi:sugar lactone lactonase YvrE
MLSLCFNGSRSRVASPVASGSAVSRPVSPSFGWACSRLAPIACAVVALGAVGCGDSDDEGDSGPVVLADSGAVRPLTTEIGIPTTVAVAGETAWVVESQFDRYPPFGGTEAPGPFRLIGVALDASGDADEIPLPEAFFPEGITATRAGRLFVGSIANGNIYTVAPNERVAELFYTELAPSAVGMTVSNDSATLWVCNNPAEAASQVVGIAIQTRAVVATHEITVASGAEGTFCNDLVMSPDGALWITESMGGQIFRIAPDELERDNSADVWLQDDLLGPPEPGQFGINGITLLNGQLYTVVTDRRTLVAIDPAIENPTGADLRVVALNEGGAAVDLVRPDGVTAVPGSTTQLLVVENGLGEPDGKIVVVVQLDVAE